MSPLWRPSLQTLPFMLPSVDCEKKCLFYDDVIPACVKLCRNTRWMSMSCRAKHAAETGFCYFCCLGLILHTRTDSVSSLALIHDSWSDKSQFQHLYNKDKHQMVDTWIHQVPSAGKASMMHNFASTRGRQKANCVQSCSSSQWFLLN